MGFKGTKNYTLNHRTLKDYHNDRGFKTKNFNIKKDDSITRIVTQGGSSVYGYQLQNDQTWPSYLQSELNNKDSEYEVINLGITNYNTFQTLKTPLKVHKDTQGQYPYKKQFYIYKGI